MFTKRANQFEASLQRAAQGKAVEDDWARLVDTARSVSAMHVPPPPRGLEEGRRRLMAEASRLSPRRSVARPLPFFAFNRMRLAAVVASLLVVVALLPGLTYAVATSTDGSPLYGLKILGQEARLWLTNNPEEVAHLQVSMAEEQMEDVVAALEQGEPVGQATVERVENRLFLAIEAVGEDGGGSESAPRVRLMSTVQSTHHVMMQLFGAASDPEFEPIHHLMRSMERAREQLNVGSGQAQGEQERSRVGAPVDDQEFGEHGPQRASQGASDPNGPAASQPGPASDSSETPADAAGPAHGASSDTTGTSAPGPGEPGANGDGQEQTQGGPDDDSPEDSHQSGQKGNTEHSHKP